MTYRHFGTPGPITFNATVQPRRDYPVEDAVELATDQLLHELALVAAQRDALAAVIEAGDDELAKIIARRALGEAVA